MEAASLRLNALVLKHVTAEQQDVISRIATHYTRQVVMETYKLLGAVDLLGNPAGVR